jgi:hypothetical protein
MDPEPDPDPNPDSLEMLDPDLDSINPISQHWFSAYDKIFRLTHLSVYRHCENIFDGHYCSVFSPTNKTTLIVVNQMRSLFAVTPPPPPPPPSPPSGPAPPSHSCRIKKLKYQYVHLQVVHLGLSPASGPQVENRSPCF